MATDVGIKLAVEGEQNFKTAVNAAKEEIKAMDAELQRVVASMTGMESAEEKLAAKSDVLTRQVDKNKEKMDILSKQYEAATGKLEELGRALDEAKAKGGDNETDVTRAANAYNKQAGEVAKLKTQMEKTSTAIETAERELSELTAEAEASAKAAEQTGKSYAETGKEIEQFGKDASKAGKKLSDIGSTLTKSVSAPLAAAGTAAVKFASDYEENLNKVDASFKDSAKVVKDWAKTATEQFGMSESAALEATSLFGDMGTSMGLTTTEAANMSTSLAGLAGDLSSFKNIGVDEAMTALKGVFTGETESLKTLGVVMTETNLKQFASDAGLVYDEMDQAEKVTLRYQYVLENTKNAQGDYARTSDGTANSMRTLAAEAENAAAAFGEEILPTITPMIQGATDLIHKFGELDEGTKEMIIKAGALTAAAGPVLSVGGNLIDHGGSLITTIGKVTGAMSGGGGLASALVSTLGTGGTVGLAIAGVAALTAVTIGVASAIGKAIDPVNRLQDAIEQMDEAQQQVAASSNIVELADRYEALRAKTQDVSISSEELAEVQAELDDVRTQLSQATDGAVSTEGDYNGTLDKTVEKQKELAEQEKERSNQEIYIGLVKGADAYHKTLEKQEKKQDEIQKAEGRMQQATEQLSEATEDAGEEFRETGKLSLHMRLELDDAATCAEGATDTYNDLQDELAAMEAETEAYEASLIGLVRDGFLPTEDAAVLLGVSQEDLRRKINDLEVQEREAANSAEHIAEESLAAAEAEKEQADAAKQATDAIWGIASAAVDARYSSEDLRASYEELKGQLDDVRESGDAEAVQAAEQKLAALELAATNQELAGAYTTLGIATGESLTQMSEYLIATGTSTADFAAGVTSMRDSVVNDFQSIVNENALTAEQIIENLETNLQVQQQWSQNLSGMWEQAKTDQDTNVMAFINYLREKGPEYAGEVQSFADAGYEELKRAAELWGGAATQAVNDYAAQMQAEDYLAEQAAGGVGQASLTSIGGLDYKGEGSNDATEWAAGFGSVDTFPAGEDAGDKAVSGVKSQAESMQTASKGLADTANAAWANSAGEFQQSGVGAGTKIKIGLMQQQSSVRTAGQALADAVNSAWRQTAGDFRESGASAAEKLASGISRERSTVTGAAKSVAVAAQYAADISGWYGVGYNMAAGIADGVYGGSYLISSAAQSAAYAALSSAKYALGIHSPSKVFKEQVGKMIPAGMAEGINGAKGAVEAAIAKVSDGSLDALAGNMLYTPAGSRATGAGGRTIGTMPIVVNIYPQPEQNAEEIVDTMLHRVERQIKQKGAALRG